MKSIENVPFGDLKIVTQIEKNGSLIYKVNRINSWTDYKILIKPITNLKFYYSYLNSNHKFEKPGKYEISLKIGNESKTISEQISVVDLRYSDFYCENSVNDNSLDCQVHLISQSKNDLFRITFGKCVFYDLINDGEIMDGFGFFNSSKFHGSYPNNTSLLLVNTEFKFEAYLLGFEFEVSNSGILIVSLYNFGQNESNGLQKENQIGIWHIKTSFGINKITLEQALKVPKGSMIVIDSRSTSKIILNIESFNYKSDLIISDNRLMRPNKYRNSYFSFKCLIDKKFYLSNLKITKFFQYPKIYKVQLGSSIQHYAVNYRKKFFLIKFFFK